jgi:FdhD protein
MLNRHNENPLSANVKEEVKIVPLFQETKDGRLHSRQMVQTDVLALRNHVRLDQADWLAAEEPLEIRVCGPDQDAISVAVTMRTPGHDDELAIGFLYTEGLLRSGKEIIAVDFGPALLQEQPCNIVTVRLSHSFDPAPLKRNFYTTSSCGICGKASLEQIAIHCTPVASGPVLPGSVLIGLPPILRQAQQVFDQTGGLHASGLFDLSGQLVSFREDVGRHNAVDKLVGQMVLAGETPLNERVLLVSGRTSFEIMQKAAMARVPLVCAVSAPSSLAVEVAKRFRMTLVGFLRDQSFNVYSHPERIALGS